MKKENLKQTPSVEAVANGKALNKIMEWQKKNPPSEIERLRFQAANALSQLRELAKTDMSALEVLAAMLLDYTRGLKGDALENPEHYRKLTKKCATWPASVSVDKEIQNDQMEFAREMQLGEDAPLNYKGRQWSRKTPEIKAALRLIGCLQSQRSKLPPLSRETAPEWWKASQDLFYSIYGNNFERHRLFAARYQQTDARIKQANKKGLDFETWQRQQILTKMAQAFHTIARKANF